MENLRNLSQTRINHGWFTIWKALERRFYCCCRICMRKTTLIHLLWLLSMLWCIWSREIGRSFSTRRQAWTSWLLINYWFWQASLLVHCLALSHIFIALWYLELVLLMGCMWFSWSIWYWLLLWLDASAWRSRASPLRLGKLVKKMLSCSLMMKAIEEMMKMMMMWEVRLEVFVGRIGELLCFLGF